MRFTPTHGLSRTKEYQAWHKMKRRCLDQTRKDYSRCGGRGILLCQEWHSFAGFIKDMGLRPSPLHSIDRIDNDGNYEPGNCRWATAKEQQNNKTTNRYVEYRGARTSVADAVRASGSKVSRFCVYQRLNAGWPVAKAIETPAGGK
jgi:hypothetical protein